MKSLLLALALSPLLAHAAGGAYEINQDCAAVGCFANDAPGFPVSITQAGSYVLTSDIVLPAGVGGVAIVIDASPVDLDLNHHTIDGGGSCTGSPVSACTAGAGTTGISGYSGGGVAVLHLHDGTIKGFTNTTFPAAVYLSDVGDGTVLERLNIVESGGTSNGALNLYTAGVGGMVRVLDSIVARSRAYGISNRGGSIALVVTNSQITGNGTYGIAGFAGTFTNNRFDNNGNYAVNPGVAGYYALGDNSFSNNNGGGANEQYSGLVRDMGGNVCIDHMPCP